MNTPAIRTPRQLLMALAFIMILLHDAATVHQNRKLQAELDELKARCETLAGADQP